MERTIPQKIAILGYGRHGKDLVAEIVSKFTRLRYGGSTSWIALPYVAKALDVHQQIAWDSRHDNRQFWYDFCNHLRRNDASFLVKKVLKAGDLVVGLRDKEEVVSLKRDNLVRATIWVDASPRIEAKDHTVAFGPEDCDMVLKNHLDKDALYFTVYTLCKSLGLPMRHADFYTALEALEAKPELPVEGRTER